MGAMLVYPEVVYLQLDLSPAGQRDGSMLYSGPASVQNRKNYHPGRTIENDINVETGQAELQYVPANQTFVLVLNARNRYGGRYLGYLRRGEGVVDSGTGRFAGTLKLRPGNLGDYFHFERPGDFEAVAKNYGDFHLAQGRISPVAKLAAPSKGDLVAWFEPFVQNHPDVDLYHVAHGTLELMAIDLFADAHFSKYFGKRFDELSGMAMIGTGLRLSQDLSRSQNRNERSLGTLSRMFYRGTGSPSGMETLQGVLALRVYTAWFRTQIDQLAVMPPTEADWKSLAALEPVFKAGAPTLSLFLPTRYARAQQQIQDARQRIAYPLLETQIAALESRRQQPSQDLLTDLIHWPATEREKLSCLSISQRNILHDRIQAIKFAVVEKLVPPHVERLKNLGQGFEAVLAGNEWYRRLNSAFQGATDAPAYRQALEAFQQHRKTDLDTALPVMLEKVSAFRYKDLGIPKQSWLATPKDSDSPVYAAVDAALAKRKSELIQKHKDDIEKAIAQALKESRENPKQPLRYVDMSKYAASELMSVIYYGTMNHPRAERVIQSMSQGDLGSIFKSAAFSTKMKLVFQMYHQVYYERYRNSPPLFRLQPEEWATMVIHHTTRNGFGTIVDSYDSTDIDVRRPYAKAYEQTLIQGSDVLVTLFDAASKGQLNKDSGIMGVVGDMFSDSMRNKRSFEQFLSDYRDDYPATVYHFEQNLMKAFTLQDMEQIKQIEIEPLE